MHSLCLILIFLGVFIMAFSIMQYYKILLLLKKQNYETRVFQSSLYGASFIMMCFFLVGYIIIGVILFSAKFRSYYIIISLIFFFGGIFVLCMVNVQRLMSAAIIKQTGDILQSMIIAMEAKDNYTRGHSEHVCRLVKLLYEHLPTTIQRTVNYEKLADAALLHDIGKIAIPDQILNKPGRLNEDEMAIIRQHPKRGKEILQNTSYCGICDWILYHHERMDGKGYYNLPGKDIPMESRIIALADVFSALYTDRVYRPRFSFEEAMNIIQGSAGTQLDSALVEIFCSIEREEIDSASLFDLTASSFSKLA